MDGMSGRRLSSVVTLVAGLALLVLAGVSFIGSRESVDGFASTRASLVSAVPGKETAEPAGSIHVRFETRSGQPVTAPLQTGLFGAAIDLSRSPVWVRYDPARPQHVVLDHPLALYDVPLLLAPMGVALLLVSAIIRAGNRQRAQARQRWAPPPRSGRRPAHELAPAQSAAERLQRTAGVAVARLSGTRGPVETMSVGDRRPSVVPRAETLPAVVRPGASGGPGVVLLVVGVIVAAVLWQVLAAG